MSEGDGRSLEEWRDAGKQNKARAESGGRVVTVPLLTVQNDPRQVLHIMNCIRMEDLPSASNPQNGSGTWRHPLQQSHLLSANTEDDSEILPHAEKRAFWILAHRNFEAERRL